jgi:TolB-like protein/Tfp pilus assembly protein PilF
VALGALAYFAIEKFLVSKHLASQPTTPVTPASVTPTAFAPPPHSIAVLPFVNMSGDKEQEYFSDGLTEEILNSLARISELQVSARTSAFSFKGKDVKIGTIARELNVGSILEGSVRRSGHTIRVTAQLNNAVTGFHVWSQTYDRDLSDVLKLQTDIANAVANALKVTLLGDVAAKIEVGGTRNPAAFDAYLRGSNAVPTIHNLRDAQTAVAFYTDAIRHDPRYAQAFAARSLARFSISLFATTIPAIRENLDAQRADAREALRLTPDLGEGHLALARYFEDSLDFARAGEEFERALALAPGDARVLRSYGLYAVAMGRTDDGIAALHRAVVLDPLNPRSHSALAVGLDTARRYPEAIAAYEHSLALDPDSPQSNALRGFSYYALGDFQRARASCETAPEFFLSQTCLAMTYDKLGRHADAEAALAKVKALGGDAEAYQYVQIYAQWGDQSKALEWLETAVQLHDLGLEYVKTDHFLDPLRKERRFQSIERELKFPT